MIKLTHTNKEGNNLPVMVFKNIRENKAYYNIGLSRKDIEGNYINGSIMAQFNKDVELENQTKIILKNAVLDFYKKDKITVPFIRVFDYELENTQQKNDAPATIEIPEDEELPF